MPEFEGPIATISRFPGWIFELVQRKSAIGLITLVAGRRDGRYVILCVDRWDAQAAEALGDMIRSAESELGA